MASFTYLVFSLILSVLLFPIEKFNVLKFSTGNNHVSTAISSELKSPLVAAWYLNARNCSETFSTACCCSDGNQHICDLPGASFECYPGGPFQCTADLGKCEENPGNCENCCHPCGA